MKGNGNMGFFDDQRDPRGGFKWYNPFSEEFELVKNAYRLGLLMVSPFFLLHRLFVYLRPSVNRAIRQVFATLLTVLRVRTVRRQPPQSPVQARSKKARGYIKPP